MTYYIISLVISSDVYWFLQSIEKKEVYHNTPKNKTIVEFIQTHKNTSIYEMNNTEFISVEYFAKKTKIK